MILDYEKHLKANILKNEYFNIHFYQTGTNA